MQPAKLDRRQRGDPHGHPYKYSIYAIHGRTSSRAITRAIPQLTGVSHN